MDEILTEELINKEKYILEEDNYIQQEDFFRINNHGDKSIYDNINKSKSNNNANISINDSQNFSF